MFGRQPLSTAPFCTIGTHEIVDAYQRLRARDLSQPYISVRDLSGPAILIRDESEGSP
jgi:hypothetical protein